MLIVSITLSSCTNKQAKIYNNYLLTNAAPALMLVKSMGANVSIKCNDANFIKITTYKDSLDAFVDGFNSERVRENKSKLGIDSIEIFIMNNMKNSLKNYHDADSLVNCWDKRFNSDNGSYTDLEQKENCQEISKESNSAAAECQVALNLIKKYRDNENKIIGNLYACKVVYTMNGVDQNKIDTVLFSPDKNSVIQVVKE